MGKWDEGGRIIREGKAEEEKREGKEEKEEGFTTGITEATSINSITSLRFF